MSNAARETRSVVVEREFSHAPEKLWRALTQPHLMEAWLNNFSEHISLNWWYFGSAALIALAIAWLTVGLQTIRAARVNPVQCLKTE